MFLHERYPLVKDNLEYPYFYQWAVWCWRKPIYIGLSLLVLCFPILVLEGAYLSFAILSKWGKKI